MQRSNHMAKGLTGSQTLQKESEVSERERREIELAQRRALAYSGPHREPARPGEER